MIKIIRLLLLICGSVFVCADANAQKPVLTIPSGQNTWLTAFRITTNSRYLLTAAMDNSIKIYDLKAKREVFTFWGHSDYVEAIDIAPDNRTVVSGDQNGVVIFWDLNTGKVKKKVNYVHGSSVTAIAFSADGNSVISADWKGDVARWDARKMDSLYSYNKHSFPISKVGITNDALHYLTVAPDTLKTDTMSNMMYTNSKTGYGDISIYLSSALLRSATLSKDGRTLYYITDSPAQIRKIAFPENENIFKEPLPEGLTPLDVVIADEKTLLISCQNDEDKLTVLVFDVLQKKILKTIKAGVTVSGSRYANSIVQQCLISKHEMVFINGGDFKVYKLDINTGNVTVINPKNSSNPANPVLVDGNLYLSGEDDALKKWELKTNELTTLATDTSHYYSNTKCGTDILIRSLGKWLVWDTQTQKLKKTVPEPLLWVVNIYLSPGEKFIAVPFLNGDFKIYRTGDYSYWKTIHTKMPLDKRRPRWHDDHTLAFTSDEESDCIIHLFDVGTEKFLTDSIRSKFSVSAFARLNGDEYAAGILGGVLRIFSTKTDSAVLRQVRLRDFGRFFLLRYDTRLNKILASLEDGEIMFIDPVTLKTERTLKGHKSWIIDIEFMDDYSRAYTTCFDNSIKIWDMKTGTVMTTLSILDQKEWVSVDENKSLFDASPQAMKLMYYVVNDSTDTQEPWKIIELEQLKHRYYQPGLLQIQLGYNNEPLREVPQLEKIEFAPKLNSNISGNSLLTIKVKNQRGGIGKVVVFLNNAEIIADARPKGDADKNLPELTISVDLYRFAARFAGQTTVPVKVIAWNGGNWLSSMADTLSFSPLKSKGADVANAVAKKPAEKTRLFAVVFGTSDYAGSQIDLRYSSKDAADFAAALRTSAQKLFGVSDVDVTLFNSDDKTKQPEKKNLTAAMDALSKKMKPSDLLVIYLSGHGVNYGGADGDFYYLTKEAAGADAAYLADPAVRTGSAISSAELTGLLNKITARKKILILDACASGKAAETMLAAARDVPSSQVRALDRMQDRTGFYILSGSASDAVSYESSVYGQGLLTYSLLKAMRGAALRIDGGEEYVDIQKLLQYAVDEVPKLAEGIGGIQKPLYRSPDNQQSFDIGKVDDQAKQAIVLSEPKPVFVAVGFQEMTELFDKVNLSDRINAAIRENTAKGKAADFVFTEAKDYPGAYRVSGNYEMKDSMLSLRYVITKDKQRIGDVRNFTASYTDPAAFADNFMNELRKTLQK